MKNSKYTNSIFYEIVITGKYMKRMAEGLFKKLELTLTNEEFSILDFLYNNSNKICQRDLAIKTFSDRANIGKVLNGLEKKGYISRELSVKQNYPAKIVSLTEKGIDTYCTTLEKLRDVSKNVLSLIEEDEKKIVIATLQKIRKSLVDVIDIKI